MNGLLGVMIKMCDVVFMPSIKAHASGATSSVVWCDNDDACQDTFDLQWPPGSAPGAVLDRFMIELGDFLVRNNRLCAIQSL